MPRSARQLDARDAVSPVAPIREGLGGSQEVPTHLAETA